MSRALVSSLLLDLARDGVAVSATEGKIRVAAPKGSITPERREVLQEQRSALLDLMKQAEGVLDAPLCDFERSCTMIEVAVPGLKETLWFVPAVEQVAILIKEGVRPGRIWTANELRDLMAAPGMNHEDAISVARAKLAFSATVVDVRPAEQPAPEAPPTHREPVQPPLDLEVPPTEEHGR